MLRTRLFPAYRVNHKLWILSEYLILMVYLVGMAALNVSMEQRFALLLPWLPYTLLILWRAKQAHLDFGLHLTKAIPLIPRYLTLTIALVGLLLGSLYIGTQWLGLTELTNVSHTALAFEPTHAWWLIPSEALLIAWLFFGFLLTRLEMVSTHPITDALLVAIGLVIVQSALGNAFLLGAVFVSGLAIAWQYYHKPNYPLAALATGAINGVIMLLYSVWSS